MSVCGYVAAEEFRELSGIASYIIIITAIGLSLGGSSVQTSTDKRKKNKYT
jgi:hypothetical protein